MKHKRPAIRRVFHEKNEKELVAGELAPMFYIVPQNYVPTIFIF